MKKIPRQETSRSKKEIIQSLEKRIQEVKTVFSLVKSSKDVRPWLETEENSPTIEELNHLMSFFQQDKNKKQVIFATLDKDKVRIKTSEMPEVLKFLQGDESRLEVANNIADKFDLDFEEIINIITTFEKDNYIARIALFNKWIEKDNNNVDITDLSQHVIFNEDFTGHCQARLFISWLKQENNNVNVAILKDVITSIIFEPQIEVEKEVVRDNKVNNDNLKLEIVKSVFGFLKEWVEKIERGEDVQYNSYRVAIAEEWLQKEGNNLSFLELVEILNLYENDDNIQGIVRYWALKKDNKLNLEEFENVISALKTTSIDGKKDLFKDLLQDDKLEITFEEFEKIVFFNELNIDLDSQRIIKIWFEKNANKNLKHFASVVNRDVYGSPYNYPDILQAYQSLGMPIEEIGNFCNALYPNNELCRVELFSLAVSNGDLNLNNHELVKSFIKSIQDDNLAYGLVRLFNKRNSLSNLDILEIARDRVDKQYGSIKDALNKPLLESILPELTQNIKDKFGHSEYNQVLNSKTLIDLFSYYDLKDKLAEFKSIVKPEILLDISLIYSPIDTEAYILNSEYQKLQNILNIDENIIFELPSLKILSDYLKSKAIQVPQKSLSEETANSFNFGESEFLKTKSSQDLEKITNLFKDLLRSPSSLTDEKVVNFIEEILGEKEIISKDSKEKLFRFFRANIIELEFFFRNKDGIDQFTSTIGSVSDGCVANIATQFKILLNQFLIKDTHDQVLYSVFRDKISSPILNSGGDNIGSLSTGADIFSSRIINDSVLSPTGFVNFVTEEFVDNGKIVNNPFNFIRDVIDNNSEISKQIGLTNDNLIYFDSNEKSAKVATLLAIKLSIPEILDNKYFTDFKKSCTEIVEEAQTKLDIDLAEEQSPNTSIGISNCESLVSSERVR